MSSKSEELMNADWDDTELIAAFEKSLKDVEVKTSSERHPKAIRDNNKSPEWRVGDFCRALYERDQTFYEATITSIFRNNCTVEFIGYKNEEEVKLNSLKESHGKKARKKQMVKATREWESEEDGSNGVVESSSCSEANTSQHSRRRIAVENGHNTESSDTCHPHTTDNRACTSHYSHAPAYDHNAYSTGQWHDHPMPPAPFAPQPSGMNNLPFSFPTMAHCHDVSADSNFSSMLAAWYMAGYYTGLHQGEKKCRKCCCHS